MRRLRRLLRMVWMFRIRFLWHIYTPSTSPNANPAGASEGPEAVAIGAGPRESPGFRAQAGARQPSCNPCCIAGSKEAKTPRPRNPARKARSVRWLYSWPPIYQPTPPTSRENYNILYIVGWTVLFVVQGASVGKFASHELPRAERGARPKPNHRVIICGVTVGGARGKADAGI